MPNPSSSLDIPPVAVPLVPGELSALAHRVESALDGNRVELAALHDQLLDQVRSRMQQAGWHPTKNTPEFEAAYQLGQLSFAQHLLAQALGKRADDSFIPNLHSPRYSPYVGALDGGEKTVLELATAVNGGVEGVRVILGEMRELGMAEFVRKGAEIVNFLTPLAKAGWRPTAP